jgi:hypothetical protein
VIVLRWLYRPTGADLVSRPLVGALIGLDTASADQAVIAGAFAPAGQWIHVRRHRLAQPGPLVRGSALRRLTTPTLPTRNTGNFMWTVVDAAAVVDAWAATLALAPGHGTVGPLLLAPDAVAGLTVGVGGPIRLRQWPAVWRPRQRERSAAPFPGTARPVS